MSSGVGELAEINESFKLQKYLIPIASEKFPVTSRESICFELVRFNVDPANLKRKDLKVLNLNGNTCEVSEESKLYLYLKYEIF